MSEQNPIVDPNHERAGLLLIRQAIRRGWQIPDVLVEQLPRQVTALLVNARNDREKLRAAEVLVAMQRDNVASLALADKIQRLELGQATERVEHLQSISDEQLAAAAIVIGKRKQTDTEPKCPKPKAAKRSPRK